MQTEISIDFVDLFIFLGIFQGILLSWIFLKKYNREKSAYFYQGILLLAFSLAIFEEFLNNTGYIVKVLHLSNFAEPLNLAFGPLVFLYVKRTIKQKQKGNYDYLHFIIFFLYLLYMGFYFFQPEAIKYNSYIHSKHPDWPKMVADYAFSEDPLGIRSLINTITAVHFSFYLGLTVYEIWFKRREHDSDDSHFRRKLTELKSSTIHFIVLIIIFIAIKIIFEGDLGDYFIALYITLLFYITTYRALVNSSYFKTPHSFLEIPMAKYKKSSLTEKQKDQIENAVKKEMEEKQYYSEKLASLSGLADRLKLSSHHVSQVINERLGSSFYSLLAFYRIEAAKNYLKNQDNEKTSIEEIMETVGYSSRSSFNTAFKKQTGKTPSQFREQPD
jgi:AraC-like DNA-binding protein